MANLRANNLNGTGGRNAIDGSLYFGGYVDGANADHLQLADLDDLDMGTGEFTFETWIKPVKHTGTNDPNYMGFFCSIEYGVNDSMTIQVKNDGKLRYIAGDGSDDETGTSVLWGNWNHVAIVRSGSTIKGYVNGIEEISSSYSSAVDFGEGGGTVIGELARDNYPGDYPFRGFISNLRLIKGSALYTTAFTPPTEKLTVVDGTVLLCCQDSMNPEQEATGKTLTGYGDLTVSDGVDLVTGSWTDVSSGSASASGSGKYCTAAGTDLSNRGAVYTSCTVVAGKKYDFGWRTVAGITNCKIGVDSNDGTNDQRDSVGNNPDLVYPVAADSTTITGRKYRGTFTATTTTADVYFQGINGTVTADEIFLRLYDNSDSWRSNNELPPVGVDEGVVFDGSPKFNTQGAMYFPTGDTSQRSRGRAVFGGDKPASNVISYLSIQAGGIAQDFGDLVTAGYGLRSGSSHTRGLFAHSASTPYTNSIEYVTIATAGNAADFGDMTATSSSGATGGNDTRAIFWEGTVPATGVNICYATFASTGNAADFGDMTIGVRHIDTVNSTTRCVIPGGWKHPADNTNVIQYVTTATTGNATDFGDVALSGGIRGAGSFSSPTRGVWGGGADTPGNNAVNVIEYITIATTGNATDFGDITTAYRTEGGGTSSHTRGLFCGGYTPAGNTNAVEYVTISTTGKAQDFGDAVQSGTIGACSDCHGGLS